MLAKLATCGTDGEFRNTLAAGVLRIKESALRHGLTREDISHAYDMAIFGAVLDHDHDPPKLLFIGPTGAGNLLELIGGDFESGDRVIWHAMACRPQYSKLLVQMGRAV